MMAITIWLVRGSSGRNPTAQLPTEWTVPRKHGFKNNAADETPCHFWLSSLSSRDALLLALTLFMSVLTFPSGQTNILLTSSIW